MNIYDYFLSPDIAEHCEKIGHEFSPLDMAVIIDRSDKTVEEKHAAWQELISDYPDMQTPKRSWFSAEDGLHKYLKKLMSWEKKIVKEFMTPDPGALYQLTIHEPYEYKGSDSRYSRRLTYRESEQGNYSSVAKALDTAREENEEDEVGVISITKVLVDVEGKRYANFNYAGDLLSIVWGDYEKGAPDMLEMVFIDLPVPFVKGDLVLLPDGNPGVISYLPHWGREGGETSYQDLVAGALRSDGSDMHANAYEIGYDNTLCYDHYEYFPMQYFRGELKGQDQFLKYLSMWMKGENFFYGKEPWVLINTFMQFYLEAESEKLNRRFGKDWYKREAETEES